MWIVRIMNEPYFVGNQRVHGSRLQITVTHKSGLWLNLKHNYPTYLNKPIILYFEISANYYYSSTHRSIFGRCNNLLFVSSIIVIFTRENFYLM
ncbi:hypothetical protein RCL_jg27620.t1 [Rhizophagus clarus]|uniref:Uncharacterized protein n=1 Tax=Rhizophagus clarus TaxID=94130 RepID=A0A8H3QYP0_9GLOM|nr:hypothetical protein RCL_jg27620.t1 [Rhizophagus clarus]